MRTPLPNGSTCGRADAFDMNPTSTGGSAEAVVSAAGGGVAAVGGDGSSSTASGGAAAVGGGGGSGTGVGGNVGAIACEDIVCSWASIIRSWAKTG